MERISIVKIGGKVIEDPELLRDFLQDFTTLTGPKLLVHGGGRNATQLAQRLGLEATMIKGRRVTDAAMLDVVVMVYAGLVNKQIISALQSMNCNAVGLTGADADCIRAVRRAVQPGAAGPDATQPIDFGYVGDVQRVRAEVFLRLLEQGVVPVLAPVTHDGRGQLLNTNADTIARQVAAALTKSRAVDLYYLFEKPGVLRDPADDTSLIHSLSEEAYRQQRDAGKVVAGMIPKLDNAFSALRAGAKNVYIAHHSALAHHPPPGTQLCLSNH